MKSSLISAIGLASFVALAPVHAQTYQWKDGNGRTVISDTPPPGSIKASRAYGVAMPNSSTEKQPITEKDQEKGQNKPPEAPKAEAKSTAEKDLEFKKRQQEAKEKAEKEAKEQAAAKERQDNCERARHNLAALESNQPLSNYDDKGERRFMDAGQREQEAERTRRIIAEVCK